MIKDLAAWLRPEQESGPLAVKEVLENTKFEKQQDVLMLKNVKPDVKNLKARGIGKL
jgi:hypothetical protein